MAYTQRTTEWVINRAYLHATRKSTAPVTEKLAVMLAIVDSMQKQWEQEPDVEWSSLYELVTLTPTVTATDTFALHDDINYLSTAQDEYVLVTDGTSTTKFTIVNPNQLYRYKDNDACAKIGRTLKFSRAFAADSSMLGYNIKVPAITFVDDIDSTTDIVQVDDPMWLVYMSAYEFVRNDLIKRNTKDDLLDLAQNVMTKMKEVNGGSVDKVPMTTFINAGEDL